MKPAQLLSNYRNLLIALARYYGTILARSEELTMFSLMEPDKRKRGGLGAKANELKKQAQHVKFMLESNADSLHHFFGKGIQLDAVALEQVKYFSEEIENELDRPVR